MTELSRACLEVANLLRNGALCTGSMDHANSFREYCLEQAYFNFAVIISELVREKTIPYSENEWKMLVDLSCLVKKRSIPVYMRSGL